MGSMTYDDCLARLEAWRSHQSARRAYEDARFYDWTDEEKDIALSRVRRAEERLRALGEMDEDKNPWPFPGPSRCAEQPLCVGREDLNHFGEGLCAFPLGTWDGQTSQAWKHHMMRWYHCRMPVFLPFLLSLFLLVACSGAGFDVAPPFEDDGGTMTAAETESLQASRLVPSFEENHGPVDGGGPEAQALDTGTGPSPDSGSPLGADSGPVDAFSPDTWDCRHENGMAGFYVDCDRARGTPGDGSTYDDEMRLRAIASARIGGEGAFSRGTTVCGATHEVCETASFHNGAFDNCVTWCRAGELAGYVANVGGSSPCRCPETTWTTYWH